MKNIQLQRSRHKLTEWLNMPEEEVINKFSSLNGAKCVGKGSEQFVFIPGTRQDRVLLVSHADTVWDDKKRQVVWCNGKYYSNIKDVGIGADDRAGIAMLWKLRNSGHSILVTRGEERGCKAAHALIEHPEWEKVVNEHQFSIEFDRMGEFDLAFYDVATDKFKDWVEKNMPKYKRIYGVYTDICILCKKICGVNFSVGYYGQHSKEEYLIEKEWEQTFYLAEQLLKQDKLPQFLQESKPQPKESWSNGGTTYNIVRHNHTPPHNIMCFGIIQCMACEGIMDETEYNEHGKKCIFCNQ